MGRWNKISRDHQGQEVPGVELRAFIHNGPYHLAEIKVFKDGMIDCWGLETFEGFKRKVHEGWVVTSLPEGAEVSIHSLGQFTATEVFAWVKESELVKEVADLIEELNERPTASDRCLRALKVYKEDPSETNKALLKEAFEAIPEHNRLFVLGDQDLKDFPIRMILYGDEEVENWSHRQASRQLGMEPLPEIDVPEVLEEIFPSPETQVHGQLRMALDGLYRHPGIGAPLFSPEVRDEVDALFRRGEEEAGLRRFHEDVAATLKRHGSRPFIVTRLAGALSSLGDYLEETHRDDAAVEVHMKACRLHPDGFSPTRLAQLAVKHHDAELARKLAETMREFGLEPIADESLAEALGLDVGAFRNLLSSPP